MNLLLGSRQDCFKNMSSFSIGDFGGSMILSEAKERSQGQWHFEKTERIIFRKL